MLKHISTNLKHPTFCNFFPFYWELGVNYFTLGVRRSKYFLLNQLNIGDFSWVRAWHLILAFFPNDWVGFYNILVKAMVKVGDVVLVLLASWASIGWCMLVKDTPQISRWSATKVCFSLIQSWMHQCGCPVSSVWGSELSLPYDTSSQNVASWIAVTCEKK